MSELPKIAPAHLRRAAYVYVRQSTALQVREHTESLERQYELAERAVALGWSPAQVVVIDADLGRSGAEATAREGFQRLVPTSASATSGWCWASRCRAWPATTPTGISCSTCAP